MRLKALAATLLITCTPRPADVAPEAPTNPHANPLEQATRVSWKAATDTALDATVVVRYGAAPDGMPSGKTLPQVGDAFGSGVVVYVGTELSFTDPTLPEGCDRFTYQLWSHDKKGNWSAEPVEVQTLPGGQSTPLAPPNNLTAMMSGVNVELSWVAAAGSSKTRVVRTVGRAATSATEGTVVFDGMAMSGSELQAGLPMGQTLFYAAFACNDCGGCSPIPTSTTLLIPVTPDGGTPDSGLVDPDGGSLWRPTGLTLALSTNGQDVNLSWMNPAPASGFTQVKVLRKLNSAPAGPDDAAATQLFFGLATSTSERLDQLLPSVPGTARTYFYTVFGCANAVCETQGAGASLSPTVAQALKGGGYTIWWRHLTAEICYDAVQACSAATGSCGSGFALTSDGAWCCPNNEWWKSCSTACGATTARQLSPTYAMYTVDAGSDQMARSIHDAFTARSFPVGRVLSSEYCRARHSLETWSDGVSSHPGMDFGPTPELKRELTYFVYDEANRCRDTMRLMNEVPAAGTNTAMVSHAGNTCPTLASLYWGQGAIYKPLGENASCPSSGACGSPLNNCPSGQTCDLQDRTCRPAACVPTLITTVVYNGWSSLP